MSARPIPASASGAGVRSLGAASVCAWWLVSTVIAMGLWAQLDRLGPGIALGLAVTLLALWRRGEMLFPRERLDLRLPPRPERPALALLIGLACCAPAAAFLALTWSQNFPFVGDHDHHFFAARSAAEFWRFRAPVLLGASLALAFASRSRPSGAWPLLALGALLAWSFRVEAPLYFARYPAAFYLLATPFNLVAEQLHWASPLDANRLTNALSLPVWLFVLRPLLVKRWPDVGALAFSLFFFWQKDVVYYFASTYLEPWSVVFLLLAIEFLLVRPAEDGWLACLLAGTAAAFKEQGILVLPFVWLAATTAAPRGDRLRQLVPATVSALPFCAYFVFRLQSGIPRPSPAATDLFSYDRFVRFLWRAHVQFGAAGMLMVGVILASLLALTFLARGRRRVFACILGSAFFLWLFFWSDSGYSAFLGYPRFGLVPVAILGSALLWLGGRLAELRPRALAPALALLALSNLSTLAPALALGLQPDPARNYSEHSDSPVYFPVRELFASAEARSLLAGVRSVVINDSSLNFLMYALPVAYPRIADRYGFAHSSTLCRCRRDDEAILFPIVYPTGPLGAVPAGAQFRAGDGACLADLQASCREVLVQRMPDGSPTGALAVGPR